MDIKRLALPLANYSTDKTVLNGFIHFFEDNNGDPKYLNQITNKRIIIDWMDLLLHDIAIVGKMQANTPSYLNMLYNIIDQINIPKDIIMKHRLERIKEKFPNVNIADILPSALMRDYIVSFLPQINNSISIRQIRSSKIGHFITTKGIITKISQIKPKLTVAVYVCDSCGSETYQEIKDKQFSILTVCRSKKCDTMKIKGTLNLITRVSKFIPYLSFILQETQNDVPEGSIPRTIIVEMDQNALLQQNKNIGDLQNNLLLNEEEQCDHESTKNSLGITPGDSIFLGGIIMARQTTGLLNEMYIEGYGALPYVESGDIQENQRENEESTINDICRSKTSQNPVSDIVKEDIEDDTRLQIPQRTQTSVDPLSHRIKNNQIAPDLILRSFAPHIYGLKDVKKLLLLSLLGAPTIQKSDGMKIRGDINILLIGDPGIAKSELLKYSLNLSQRGVYTAGRGSSGVGLTASVLRDNLTKEYVLEAGAMVLSDKGTCVIDEMDKMDEKDRLSLHEVLEQQTVSINKAGINVSLLARCTVLGAANFSPRASHNFNQKKSLEWKTGLPTSLLSRFDSIVLLKDEKDVEKDKSLSSYVLNLHLNDISPFSNQKESDENLTEGNDSQNVLTKTELKEFIRNAKRIEPVIQSDVHSVIKEAYIEARQNYSSLTPRYLLSLIRLSLAHARLRQSLKVEGIDINESIRLLTLSNYTQKKNNKLAPKYYIYNEIIKMAKNTGNKVNLSDIFIFLSEFSEELVGNTIREFEESGIWLVDDDVLTIMNGS